jgi:hypothetical protein
MNEQTHLFLHGLAVKKHARPQAVAALLGAQEATVATHLLEAARRGRCVEMGEKYLLTPAGRMVVEANYSRYFAAARADQGFNAAHGRFEVINDELKQLVTDWQTVNIGGMQLANDHGDEAYDEKIVARLGALHDKALPVLKAFAASLPRFACYLGKLEAALLRVEDGEHAWLSDVSIDSYHTVWFELHEDLLRVLGRARSE